jgi:N-hydroxyarylamine O-acetyltransferase
MDDDVVAAYLRRIGLSEPVRADTAGLATLHQAHLRTVPFENLSIHLPEAIELDEATLIGKIVTRHRGGFCYELNGAFALLLTALGARVERVSAKVAGASGFGPPFDHLALVVRGSDGSGPWLVDVGFGRHSVYPLRFDDRTEQVDPGGVFLLADSSDGDVEVRKDGEPQYLIERRARELAEFEPTCWWQATSPKSHFTSGPICSLITADGRISIGGRTLIRTSDGERTEELLATDEALLAAYLDLFGLSLDSVPLRSGSASS